MRKGFTLMELLAVIVLLAIIATIAIPIFLKSISKSKTTSFERRADLYVNAVEVAIATENLGGNFNPEECIVQNDGNIKCDAEKVLEVEMKGKKPTEGILTTSGGKVTDFKNLKFEDSYVTMGEKGKHTVSNNKIIKMITFNFIFPEDDDAEEYEVEDGTTWEEFLSTNTNISMKDVYYAVSGDNAIYYLIDSTNKEVLLSDKIINGSTYSIECKSGYMCTHFGGQN